MTHHNTTQHDTLQCHYAECRCAESRGAGLTADNMKSILDVITTSDIHGLETRKRLNRAIAIAIETAIATTTATSTAVMVYPECDELV